MAGVRFCNVSGDVGNALPGFLSKHGLVAVEAGPPTILGEEVFDTSEFVTSEPHVSWPSYRSTPSVYATKSPQYDLTSDVVHAPVELVKEVTTEQSVAASAIRLKKARV